MIWFFLATYSLLFVGLVSCIGFTRRKERLSRKPFAENLRLLRAPGESTRRRTETLSEEIQTRLIALFGLPLVFGLVLIGCFEWFSGNLQTALVVGILLGLCAVLVIEVGRLMGKRQRLRDCYLGHFGERVVGECLEPLKAAGFRVFHDVPAGDPESPFNIDHVVVGPSGVFAIETKTRRKGRARAGFAEHQIIYDGRVLAYPWGEDTYGLDQARRRSAWLRDWLEQLVGRPVPVQPVLTFPGWMVVTRVPEADVVVLNPKQIPSAVALRGAPVLDETQIDLVARQLDSRCRDVEF